MGGSEELLSTLINGTYDSQYDSHSSHSSHSSHVIQPLGFQMLAVAALSLMLYQMNQPRIIAWIGTGFIFATSRAVPLSEEFQHLFIEVGILMVLFSAGLEVEFEHILPRWKIMLYHALMQISFFWVLGVCLSYYVLGMTDVVQLIYMGLCLTLSSTILVLGALKANNWMDGMVGQITLGIMLMQDIVAVVAISIVGSLDPEAESSNLGVEVGLIFVKLLVLIAALALLKFSLILDKLFYLFAQENQLLQIGALGYAFGVAAICSYVSFSAEIGCFCAGVSLSLVPFKLEIESKVEPLKTFGVVLFFVGLGFSLELDGEGAGEAAIIGSLIGLLVVFLTPWVMMLVGYFAHVQPGKGFMVGGLVNQVSEFSLILGEICRASGIFSESDFLIITMSCLVTFFLSSFGHQFIERWSESVQNFCKCLARVDDSNDHDEDVLEDHIVVLGWDDFAYIICIHLARDHNVIVVSSDPRTQRKFDSHRLIGFPTSDENSTVSKDIMSMARSSSLRGLGSFKGRSSSDAPAPKNSNFRMTSLGVRLNALNEETETVSGSGSIKAVYGDYSSPHVWEHYNFDKAKMVLAAADVMTIHAHTKLATHLNEHGVAYVTTALDHTRSQQLFEAGSTMVLQKNVLAGRYVNGMLDRAFKESKRNQERSDVTKVPSQTSSSLANTKRGSILFQSDKQKALEEVKMLQTLTNEEGSNRLASMMPDVDEDPFAAQRAPARAETLEMNIL